MRGSVLFGPENSPFDTRQTEVTAKNAAIDRFLRTNLIRDFFTRENVEREEVRRHLVGQCLNQMLQRADVETAAQRIGVLNGIHDERRLLKMLNHTGFTRAYLLKLSRDWSSNS